MAKKYTVRLNSAEKIEELLQEIYDQACRHINEIQNEMDKLMNSTNLGSDEITIDDKAKYAKSIHDFITDKNKAIAAKMDIAKFMGEVLKNSGDLSATVNDRAAMSKTGLNIKAFREALKNDSDNNGTTNYTLK